MLGGFSGELNDKQKQMLERSSQRVSELLELISDLLDIPRIEAGRIVNEMVDVSLLQVVKRALDDLQSSAKQKEVKLKQNIQWKLEPRHNT